MHDGQWTGILIILVHVAVNINIVVDLKLNIPNVGVNLYLDIIINLKLDISNGGFQYQKVTHHPV